jgi:hypothetical protein
MKGGRLVFVFVFVFVRARQEMNYEESRLFLNPVLSAIIKQWV